MIRVRIINYKKCLVDNQYPSVVLKGARGVEVNKRSSMVYFWPKNQNQEWKLYKQLKSKKIYEWNLHTEIKSVTREVRIFIPHEEFGVEVF